MRIDTISDTLLKNFDDLRGVQAKVQTVYLMFLYSC